MATQKKQTERKDAGLSPSPAWQWEKGMLQTVDILSSKKAEYLVLRWAQMVNASIREAKEEWLPRFGESQSEEDRTAKEMLERYVSQAEEHMNKLFDMADEYSKKRYTSVGQQSRVWHPKAERPEDGGHILIVDGKGMGTAGVYYAELEYFAPTGMGRGRNWDEWSLDHWAYVSDLVPKKEKKDRAI